MKLESLHLCNFRNFKEALITFDSGINGIVGTNGQGKTNLLEAIYHLVTGRSFRTHRLSDLVAFETEGFYLEATFLKNGIEQTLKITSDGTARKIFLNATPLTTLSSLFGLLPGVILSPEDEKLINGGPQTRRRFLDLQIAQSTPLYLDHLNRYIRALRQRNHLLRHKELASIEIWESELARSGLIIAQERQKATQELQNQTLSSHITLRYRSQALEYDETAYLAHFDKIREKEAKVATTLFGPHRDDLTIFFEEKEARYFASQGEQRSCSAALRLAEWTRLKELTGELPLMCIDDLGISLDKQRKEHFLEKLGSLGQVFVTSPKEFSCDHQIILQAGQLVDAALESNF
ncbi:MAG: DNA replication and repair protein RecF [Chlamydiae bacterium]|nr:DNA replication and repair protein RecF [Chlamydiota bacterium]